ncbi:MAG: CYTH domain-containing protein [Holosporales bacterium]|nr:CYTH domain-containing protein [Holosporales bacterium]
MKSRMGKLAAIVCGCVMASAVCMAAQDREANSKQLIAEAEAELVPFETVMWHKGIEIEGQARIPTDEIEEWKAKLRGLFGAPIEKTNNDRYLVDPRGFALGKRTRLRNRIKETKGELWRGELFPAIVATSETEGTEQEPDETEHTIEIVTNRCSYNAVVGNNQLEIVLDQVQLIGRNGQPICFTCIEVEHKGTVDGTEITVKDAIMTVARTMSDIDLPPTEPAIGKLRAALEHLNPQLASKYATERLSPGAAAKVMRGAGSPQ